MKTTELFEGGARSDSGDDVYLSMRPYGGDSLTINIDYRTITKDQTGEEFREQRYAARRAARTNPQLDDAMEEWENRMVAIEAETQEEILQLVVAYKNMVYGLLTLAHKKIQEDWNQNIMSQVPTEPEAQPTGNTNGSQTT